MRYYSPNTGGFYDTAVHTDIPTDAIEITAAQHQALLDGASSGSRIVVENGMPVLADALPATAEQLADMARAQRNRLLRDSDWTALADNALDTAAVAAWASYRQALRDVPEQSGFPSSVTWPTAPGA